MAPHLIIAVPSYRRPESLRTLLNQLKEQEGNQPFTVFVLNDGAFADSQELLQSFQTSRFSFRFHATPAPSGLPRARNILLDTITASFATRQFPPTLICFLDDDCEVNTKFVHEVYQAATRYNTFCFRIETMGQSGIVNTMNNRLARWALQPFIGTVVLPFGFIRGGYFQTLARPRRVAHLPGGCLIYRFDQYPILRFDEALNDGNAILEDTDFSLALARSGAKLWYISSYGILHRPGSVGGVRVDVPQEKYAYYWRHKRFLARKWCGGWALVTAFPLAFLESIVLSVMQRKWLVWVMVRAWFGRQVPRLMPRGLRIVAPMSGINPSSTLGGEVYDVALLSALAKRGVSLEILLPKGRPFSDMGTSCTVTTMPHFRGSFGYYWSMLRSLFSVYRKRPFTTIRLHSPYTMAFPVLLFKLFHPRVRLLAHYHHLEDRFFFRLITRLTIHAWNDITVLSDATARAFAERYGIAREKFLRLYPGVDAERVVTPKEEEITALRTERGLHGRFVLLHVGSLIPRKNVAFLIDLVAALPEQVVLVIAGSGSERARLMAQAEERGCRERVAFLGAISEKEKILWMHVADLLVLASLKEGFGMVVTEAALCGTSAIVSDQYALPEVVRDGVTGRVCPLTIDAWKEAVMAFFSDREASKHYGARAKTHVTEHFSWEHTAALFHTQLLRGL